ncbi:hypothetical protein RB601_002115 [Gaeumannomyces tritici]
MRSSIFRTVAAAALCLVFQVAAGALSLEDPDMGRGCGFKIAPCEAGSTCSALDPACPATRHENCQGVCRPVKTLPPPGTNTLGPIDRHTRTTRTAKKPTTPAMTTTKKPTSPATPTRKPTSRTTKKPTITTTTATTTKKPATTKKPTSRTRTTRRPPPRPTVTPPKYEDCGGKRVVPKDCPAGHVCVDDPRRGGGCGMACDAPGICVRPTTPCSGLAGVICPVGKMCVDDPRDDCWTSNGGRDCSGICV